MRPNSPSKISSFVKLSVIAFVVFGASMAEALEVRVVGKRGETLHVSHEKIELPTHVGAVTVDVLERFEIAFEGGEFGISKLFTLGQDIEVLSDTEMKAYGWCFSVDTTVPETMADQTPLQGTEQRLEWFYAYAHYKNGTWIGQCVRPQVD